MVDLHTMQDSLLCTQRTKWARVLLLLMDTIRLICTVCAAAPCLKVFSKISTFYCVETAHRSNMRVLLSGKGIALLFHSLGRSVGHSANTPFFPERKKPIKTLTREETLDIKIEIVSSFIAELTANQDKDADTSRLLQVLLAFDQMLLREKNQTVMGLVTCRRLKRPFVRPGHSWLILLKTSRKTWKVGIMEPSRRIPPWLWLMRYPE